MTDRSDKRRIVVAMSGGVDSSVAAALLKDQGHDVIGISMRLIGYEDEKERTGGCCSLDDLNDARRISDQIGIPFYVLNLEEAFRENVIKRFVSEYISGRTPNPCVLCNQRMKFEILLNKARELKADGLATGHYARIEFNDAEGRYELLKGVDKTKDQSYFLFSMTQEQLRHTLFPLGGLTKSEVRKSAARYNLRVAEKKESQEICFVPKDGYSDFITKFAGKGSCGDIVDESGKVLGRHEGIFNFTIGQRKGLGISSRRPLYVTGIDIPNNRVIVGEESVLYSTGLTADGINMVSMPGIEGRLEAVVKVRYRHEGTDAVIEDGGNNSVIVSFKEPVRAVTPGQAAVFYSGEKILGGGWIR